MKTELFVNGIIDSIKHNESGTTRRKFKSILESLGYKRSSDKIVDRINKSLNEKNVKTDRPIVSGLSNRVWITFEFKEPKRKENSKLESRVKKEQKKIEVPDDFFYNLFEFENTLEYERFQAALDSSSPIGLFIIPEKEDFYSTIIERILSYEIIRKRQYTGSKFLIGNSKLIDFKDNSNIESILAENDLWITKDIHKFSQETMQDVILGINGTELINSKNFDERFNQLSLYSNKYFNQQFFVLFNCPNNEIITKHNRQVLLDSIIDKVSYKLPYVFKLKSKYKSDAEIPKEIKKKIINHFKLLLEVPSSEIDTANKLLDSFLELQKIFLQCENQILNKIDEQKFAILSYGAESDEHIYNKYFAINTLNEKFDLSLIKTEVTEIVENGKIKYISRPDVIANGEIIVEVETLRGKAFDKNVYLQLVSNMISKSNGWTNTKLKELWIVVPGFEIARNYYQLKKSVSIINSVLSDKFGKNFKCKIFAPDYNKMKIVEVDFSNIYELTFKVNKTIRREPESQTNVSVTSLINFDSVVGLKQEKNDLNGIIKLQEKGYSSLIKGILFYGLPGCGKTLLAKAFANESGRDFFSFSPSDIASPYIGQTQKKISEIFAQVKAKSPSILFIDEIDSIAFSRDTTDTAHTDQKATINQLLIELNNIHENEDDVIVIAATNRFRSLDPALKRSGRFDRKVLILPPDEIERTNLFKFYLKNLLKTKGLANLSFEKLGKGSYSFTASDIKSLVDEIKIKLLLEDIEKLDTESLIKEIEIYRNTGQCIEKKLVVEFMKELKKNGYNMKKIEKILKELNKA